MDTHPLLEPEPSQTSTGGKPDLRPYLEHPNPLLIVISGPSGVGKDSVIRRMKELNYPFHFVITATTRPPRKGERHGVDYFFLSEGEFVRLMQEGAFLEHAWVYGEYKGVPKEQVRRALASGQDVIMRLDVQGAATVRRLVPDAILIFLLPGSEEELLNRLRQRGTESSESLQRRLATLREEMTHITEFDYAVVNREGQLDLAVEKIAAIITAEKCRTKQRVVRL
ncbi:MAG: guanylate kinase [Chloroflexi bacterium]|nr:guanylate kinase [Chloroflexota bacterium]